MKLTNELLEKAAIFLEDLNIAGDTMIDINHGEHEGGAVYLHDLLAAYAQQAAGTAAEIDEDEENEEWQYWQQKYVEQKKASSQWCKKAMENARHIADLNRELNKLKAATKAAGTAAGEGEKVCLTWVSEKEKPLPPDGTELLIRYSDFGGKQYKGAGVVTTVDGHKAMSWGAERGGCLIEFMKDFEWLEEATTSQPAPAASGEWIRFEDKKPEPGQEIMIVWPSGEYRPEFRKLNEFQLSQDWTEMRWLPIPGYKEERRHP